MTVFLFLLSKITNLTVNARFLKLDTVQTKRRNYDKDMPIFFIISFMLKKKNIDSSVQIQINRFVHQTLSKISSLIFIVPECIIVPENFRRKISLVRRFFSFLRRKKSTGNDTRKLSRVFNLLPQKNLWRNVSLLDQKAWSRFQRCGG